MTAPELPPKQQPRKPTPREVAGAVALGVAGSFLFSYLRLPLAWMLGAMAFTTIAALAGARIGIPGTWRSSMLAVLGVMLGTQFGPDLPGRIGQWVATLGGLVAYIGLVAGAGYFYLRRVGRVAPADAFFTAMPGGLNEMTMLGGAFGGDERLISLSHAVRLTLTVFTIPFWFRFFEGYVTPARPATGGSLLETGLLDLAVLGACAVAGPLLARSIRAPAPHLTGAMALSALVHVLGLTSSRVPAELVILAQICIGASLGCRFAGLDLRHAIGTAGQAVGLAVVMIGGTVLMSIVLHAITGIPVDALLLAFSPGGFGEMSLVALALDLDTAFVATHQLLRILLVIFLAPLAYRLLRIAAARRGGFAARPAPGD